MSNTIQYIMGDEIKRALSHVYRIYLCGNLGTPQEALRHIDDTQLEIGISHYNCFTCDKPHLHTTATEYNFILEGTSKILDIDTGKEMQFEKETLFVLSPNTPYASKHLANTKILFIKAPGGNDKVLIDYDKSVTDWLSSWE